MSRHPRTPQTCLAAFLEHRKLKTTNVDRTIDFYRETIQAVFAIMEAIGCHMMPYRSKRGEREHKFGMVDESDVKKILVYMESEDMAVSTRKGYIRALDQLCRHYGNNVVTGMGIQWPEDTRPNVDWLTTEQLKELIDFPMNPMQELAVNLMGRMGLRRVECIRIRPKDICATYLIVRGKGPITGKLRNVPLRDNMQPMFDRYMAYRNELIAKAREKDPDVEVPEELFINYNQGMLRPYEEDGWGFDKAVIVPLRKKLGFPFLEPHSPEDVREDAVVLRSPHNSDSEDPRTHIDRSHDQVSRDPNGRHGGRHAEGAVLTAGE